MHTHFNGAKTAALLGGMFALLLAIGGLISAGTRSAAPLWIFALIGVGTTAYGYWNSDKIAIRSMRAYEVTPEQQPAMYAIVSELSQRAGQPMPRLYVSPTSSPNAFATGRNPQHAAVCCTEGILRLLNERELRGVLGHELMHVYNRDILTSSVAAALAGVITSIAQMLMFFGGGTDENGRRNVNPIALIAISILAPLAASVIQMAVSRTREYDADQDGSTLTGDPAALASALNKISGGIQVDPLPKEQRLENTAHMMIENPFRNVGKLFSTHPPMEERIQRLRGQAEKMGAPWG
ncbi:MAG: zinc metalloprotease HtpX [Arthrobacter sp.]|nr:zinc metalloprotease HtpX [Arthrobacter sp.]